MKGFISILLIQLFCVSVFAAPAKINAPFFKVEKNGQVAYMLGTIHTGLDFSRLPQNIQDLAATSDTLVVETDIMSAQPIMAQAFPPGPKDSLKDQLTAEEWAKFTAVVEPILGPQANFVMDRLHPAIATSMYSSANFPKTDEPIDLFLVEMFNTANKPVQFLEDISVQLNVLQATQTIETLKLQLQITKAQMDQQAQLLLFIYASGSLQMIEQFLVNPMPREQLVLLLDDRNLAWQAKFEAMFDQPGIEFFAFGAAHLPTDLGMVKLVKDLGFTVTQIQN
jgi:hypothetical protein